MSEASGGHEANALLQATEIRVLTTSKMLQIERFKVPDNTIEIARAWEEWIEHFEDELTYLEINNITDKISALKIFGGPEIKKLIRNLPEAESEEGDDDYRKVKRKLENHFLPKRNKHHARYTFSKERLNSQESIANYAARSSEKTITQTTTIR